MWYTASLLFRNQVQLSEFGEILWQESIRLVEADSLEDAFERADAMGMAAEEFNRGVLQGTWEYCCVGHLHPLGTMTPCDGFEVFSVLMPESASDEIFRAAADARVERLATRTVAANDDSAEDAEFQPPENNH